MILACLGAGAQTFERFALFAGSNVGGKGTADLKYAVNDAKRIRDAFVGIGGVPEENAMLLLNPELSSFVNGLSFIGSKVKKAERTDGKTQFILYYSGHSDERGLLLYGERLEYAELRNMLAALSADVRVVILDSCSSGAFTREKGGTIAAPFLLDEASSVEGYAYITSSTAEEASQESDRIESSFFTYSLVSGLRGAADADADGQVSLSEVYEYAYDGTLSATERTRAGAQHPAFDFKLNGMGNLVLTDTRKGSAVLAFPESLSGRISVRDVSNKLVVEFTKFAGQEQRVGIEHGYYRVLLETGGAFSESVVLVDERRQYDMTRDGFKKVAVSRNATRGAEHDSLDVFMVGFGVYGDSETPALFVNAFGGKTASVDGVMLGLLYNRTSAVSSGLQASPFANIAEADFYGMQGTLGVNLAQADFFGFQSAFLFNDVAGDLKGVQLSAFNHVAGNAKFGQLGLINSVEGGGSYSQIGGLNRSASSIRGLQAGAANVAKEIRGLQLGFVNYSERHSGMQIGLVNISRELDGLPLGLIDIQFNGENRMDFIFQTVASRFDDLDDNLCASTYFRLGSKYFYKYFGFGVLGIDESEYPGYPDWFAGLGLGLRVPALFDGFAFHLDAGANYQSAKASLDLTGEEDFADQVVPQFRLFCSSKFYKNFGLIAGFEQKVYTKYRHEYPEKGDYFRIDTGYGILLVGSRFFVGFQL
jgi:hypothetical protein